MQGIISLITGVPGSGKTLGFVRWLVTDFFRSKGGTLLTNIRLHPDIIAKHVSDNIGFLARHFGYSPSYDEIYERIVMLKENETTALRETEDIGEFFKNKLKDRYEGSFICLDEIHTYCAAGMSGKVLRGWADWLATVRHNHIRFCGLTQDISQVDRCLKSRVETRTEFLSPDGVRDPYFKIPFGEWYKLLSAISNHHIRVVCSAEYKKGTNGRWKLGHTQCFQIDEKLFQFYDSFQVEAL